MKAIPTTHNGITFRSRLEVRWAKALEAAEINYLYEPIGLDLDGCWYLPDFYLPELRAFLEIKGPHNMGELKPYLLYKHIAKSELELEHYYMSGFKELCRKKLDIDNWWDDDKWLWRRLIQKKVLIGREDGTLSEICEMYPANGSGLEFPVEDSWGWGSRFEVRQCPSCDAYSVIQDLAEITGHPAFICRECFSLSSHKQMNWKEIKVNSYSTQKPQSRAAGLR